MLDRMSGKIVHIDFGDCFEVAMTREKFPEKIPFRLTRMLINAMEVKIMVIVKDDVCKLGDSQSTAVSNRDTNRKTPNLSRSLI